MIDMSHAVVKRSQHFSPGSVGMATRDQALPTCRTIERIRTGQLRRAGGDLHDAKLEIRLVLLRVRVTASFDRMAPYFLLGEVGTVEVHSRETRASRGRPVPLHIAACIDHPPYLRRRSCGCGGKY